MTKDSDQPSMTFWEHLAELRRRLIRMMLAFVVGAVLSWVFRERLLLWITDPFAHAWRQQKLPGDVSLHFQAPATLFFAYLKLSMLAGLVVALPVILYEAWAFIAPGLYKREKRLALPFVASSCALFATGGYFGFKVVFPIAFHYLLGFSGPVGSAGFEVKPTVMIDQYLEFITRMLLAFGVVFELPVLAFFLSIAGIITHRHLIRFARYFIVIAFIVGAVITPPDPASQLLLAIPLCVLYALSILVAWLFGKRPKPDAPEDLSVPGDRPAG
jgi:sec-independent protein translocase protein TatC